MIKSFEIFLLKSTSLPSSSCFRNQNVINVHDSLNLDETIKTISVDPHSPGVICTMTSSKILFVDKSKMPCEIHSINVSGRKSAAGKPLIHTQQNGITDMCCVKDGAKQLLVVAARDEGLHAYNMRTDRLEWSAKVKLPGMEREMRAYGVTTDGRGHLYVTDHRSQCIQMFSVSNGDYLGYLMKDDVLLRSTAGIRWNEATSSLVATRFARDGLVDFQIIKVSQPPLST